MPAIKSPEAVEAIENGENIVVDMKNGKIITEKGEFAFPPYPETVMEILENNGLINFIKNKVPGKFQSPGTFDSDYVSYFGSHFVI